MQLCLQCIEELNTDGYQCSRDWIFFLFFNVRCIFLFSLLQLPAVPRARTWKLAGFHRRPTAVYFEFLSFCFKRLHLQVFCICIYFELAYPVSTLSLCVSNLWATDHTSMEWMMMRLMCHQRGNQHFNVIEVIMKQTFNDVCSEVK